MNSKKGFTLIELLVVIAIIGILSGIVLSSLSTARNKANDSKVQSQLASLRAAAEIYNSSYPTAGYGTFAVGACAATAGTLFGDTTSGASNLISAILSTNNVGATKCVATQNYWAAAAGLPSNNSSSYWCVDSAGKSEGITAAQYTAADFSGVAKLCP